MAAQHDKNKTKPFEDVLQLPALHNHWLTKIFSLLSLVMGH